MYKRLFIAASLPPATSKKLFEVSKKRSHWPVNWINEKNYHLTLLFLGNTLSDDIGDIQDYLSKIAKNTNPIELKLSHWEVYPSKSAKRAKIIWVRTRFNEALNKLHKQIYQEMKDMNLTCDNISPEVIRPHITLGRVKKRPHKSFTFTPSIPQDTLELSLDNITLFESKLSKVEGEKAEYFEIKKYKISDNY